MNTAARSGQCPLAFASSGEGNERARFLRAEKNRVYVRRGKHNREDGQ